VAPFRIDDVIQPATASQQLLLPYTLQNMPNTLQNAQDTLV
jgi:hypothetical protein